MQATTKKRVFLPLVEEKAVREYEKHKDSFGAIDNEATEVILKCAIDYLEKGRSDITKRYIQILLGSHLEQNNLPNL